jgi:hypothetical protein
MSKPVESKYSKNISFSRGKKYANSENDIRKNEEQINHYKQVRAAERDQNIMIASGKHNSVSNNDDCDSHYDSRDSRDTPSNVVVKQEAPFYFEKMNLIICGMSSNTYTMPNFDTILREFSSYGKILYVTQLPVNSDGHANIQLVIDHWYDEPDIDMSFIANVHSAIINNGFYNWFSGIHIMRDPTQTIKDMGCKIVLDEIN